MAQTLNEQRLLITDEGFVGRVMMATQHAADNVINEDEATPDHDIRVALAYDIVQNPWKNADLFAIGVARNPVVTAESNDNDIVFTVNSLYGKMATARAVSLGLIPPV